MKRLTVKNITLISMMLALLIVSAFVSLPIPTLKITLQTFILFVIGALLSPLNSFITVLLYIVLGLIGLPIFSNGSGLGYIMSPSFGFLIGFLIATPMMSYIIRMKFSKKLVRYIVACLIGIFVIYAIGLPYLYYIVKFNIGSDITFKYAFVSFGLMYLPFDILKAAVAYPLINNKSIIKLVSEQNA